MKKEKQTKQVENTESVKYYSLANILATESDYNIIFGERSNGKTFAALEYGLKRYIENKEQTAYIRRWRADLIGKRAETLFSGHVKNGLIETLTNGEYNNILYKQGKWYLCKTIENKIQIDGKPFCFAFSLSEQEHDKSTSYPDITTIVFDEFLTRRYYLPDEFMLFMNTLSTIIRQRNNVKIFLLGNTVNKFCPYFAEMGLKNVANQLQGTIDIYTFGENGTKVAVEYAETVSNNKVSNKYFCFDNQSLNMITNGKWEIALYPHLPKKYLPKDVKFKYYIIFNDITLQCDIIINNIDNFTFIHSETEKHTDNDIIYTLNYNPLPNYRRRLINNYTDIDKKITQYFILDKVFYETNEIGEMVRNYIKVSNENILLK